MAKDKPLISFQGVTKTFEEDLLDFKSQVVKNVYFDIYPGEFVIIFGQSGSGKSSILNLMAGIDSPTSGRILVNGRDLTKFNNKELSEYHRHNMGMVFQQFNLIKSLNVWENVALPQTASGIRYSLRKSRALRLLKLFKLEDYADRHPNEVSGGEQQRVAICRALINNPSFLLVDEPTGNLDSKSAESVMEIFYGLNVHGNHTLVLVTHNPNQLKYASRILHVQDGIIIKEEKGQHSHEGTLPLDQENFVELGNLDDEDDLEKGPAPLIDLNEGDVLKTPYFDPDYSPWGTIPPVEKLHVPQQETEALSETPPSLPETPKDSS